MMQLDTYIVAEGPADVSVLRRHLKSFDEHKYVTSSGRSNLFSYAKSIAIARNAFVGVVMDADTTNSTLIEEQRANFYGEIDSVGLGKKIKLFLAVPNIRAAMEQKDFLKELRSFVRQRRS